MSEKTINRRSGWPKWAKWWAFDRNGFTMVYSDKPVVNEACSQWDIASEFDECKTISLGNSEERLDWKDSLHRIVDANDPAPAPAKVFILPSDPAERKKFPVYRGVMRYFPNAIACVARVSFEGNDQHHPGAPLHWDKSKSTDEGDALLRHQLGDEFDKVAWRALAQLERELEKGWRPEWARNGVSGLDLEDSETGARP